MSKLIIPYRETRNVTPALIKQVGDAWNEFFDVLQEMNVACMWASTDESVKLYVRPDDNLGDGVLN